jgi:hypothetical protein
VATDPLLTKSDLLEAEMAAYLKARLFNVTHERNRLERDRAKLAREAAKLRRLIAGTKPKARSMANHPTARRAP